MADKTEIRRSFYGEYFDEIDNQKIYPLSERRSEEIWQEHIDPKANTYFHIPNDNWQVKSATQVVTQWFEDYNRNSPGDVARALAGAVAWDDEKVVWFCINKAHVIECPWHDFKLYWINFLSCHDDAPIVINCNDRTTALVFYKLEVVVVDANPR